MTSPVIDEKVMDACVKPPDPALTSRDDLARLRTGALLLLIDAHDRKTTRGGHQTICGAAIELIDSCARLDLAMNIKTFFQKHGRIAEGDIEEMLSSLKSQVLEHSTDATKIATQLMQCPMDEDVVH